MTPWLRANASVLAISVTLAASAVAGIWFLSHRDAELSKVAETVTRIEGWAQVVEARQREDERARAAMTDRLREDLFTIRGDIRVLQSLYDGARSDINRIMARLNIGWEPG